MFYSYVSDSFSNQESKGNEIKESAVGTESKSTEKSIE